MVALGLALGASIAWGGSDFLADLVARRLPVLTLLVLSQGAGLLLLLVLLALAGQPAPSPEAVAIAAGAGLAEMVGFAAFYRSLAIGPMSVAPTPRATAAAWRGPSRSTAAPRSRRSRSSCSSGAAG
jgi:drug/metabolite transporter (DMT)-like permease